jgi:hypothetical protein
MPKTRIITGMNPKASFGNRFRSKLRGIKPSAARDNSTCKLQCTVFLKLGSHYNLPIPLRFAFGIGVSTIRYALILFLLLPLITFAETQEIKEYKVIKGDTLWDISKKELNDPFMWPRIWKENSWIANPHWIYPDQMIKIPLYLIQEKKRAAEVTPKSTEESQAPTIVAEQRYKRIKGIVLYDGTVIEGQILFMSADILKIRTKDGNTSSYSFIKEVQSFIKE